MRELSILSIFVAFSVICYMLFGWTTRPLKDPVQFSLIPMMFLGSSIRSLRIKWMNRTSGIDFPNQGYFWRDSFLSLLFGCFVFAFFRSDRSVYRHCMKDRDDIDRCVNFGGCKSGPEFLPEATIHSILFSTRWFLDSQDQGVEIEKKNCTNSKMLVPRIMKSRFRLPMEKIWIFDSDALLFKSIYVEPKIHANQSLLPQSISIEYFKRNETELVKVKMDEIYKTFEVDCVGVRVEETFSKISIKQIGECKKRPRAFKLFTNSRMNESVNLALKYNYIIKSNCDYWKIILSSVYNEFGAEDNVRIKRENMKLCELVPMFVDIYGMIVLVILMFVAAIVISIDTWFSEYFLCFLQSRLDPNSYNRDIGRFPA